MKKLFVMFVIAFSIAISSSAQNASGSCKLPGTYDYVNVDYWRSGQNLSVSNQSGLLITQLHITVTCTRRKYHFPAAAGGSGGYWEDPETITICDRNYYDIPANRTTRITDGLREIPDDSQGVKYENFKVTVGNPICK